MMHGFLILDCKKVFKRLSNHLGKLVSRYVSFKLAMSVCHVFSEEILHRSYWLDHFAIVSWKDVVKLIGAKCHRCSGVWWEWI